MSTLSATTAKRWISSLGEIAATLSAAENIPGISPDQWLEVWRMKACASGLRTELMDLAITSVTIEEAA